MTTPEETEASFYQALRDLDVAHMDQVWSGSGEVFCIHPGGHLLSGPHAVQSSWMGIMSSVDPPHIDYRVLQTRMGDDVAIHLVEENIRPAGTRQFSAKVLATNVYVREDGEWRMLSHHASLPLIDRSDPGNLGKMH